MIEKKLYFAAINWAKYPKLTNLFVNLFNKIGEVMVENESK